MPSSDIVAILAADLHLHHSTPGCRLEDDWIGEVVEPCLAELAELATTHEAPLLIAGDIFDRWFCNPVLLNVVLDSWADIEVYMIPGQHDLPNHRLDQQYRTGYGTLSRFPSFRAIEPYSRTSFVVKGQNVVLHPFPWGVDPVPLDEGECSGLHVAMIHRYVWKEGFSYPGADAAGNVSKLVKDLAGYDVALCGDNHLPFEHMMAGHSVIWNNGPIFRRSRSEIETHPRVGLLSLSGKVTAHRLRYADNDKFRSESDFLELDRTEGEGQRLDLDFSNLDDALDFEFHVRQRLQHESDAVREHGVKILDEVYGND